MAVDDLIRINGTVCSWNSVTVKLAETAYSGFLKVDYEEKLEKTLVYGSRRDGKPLGKTTGKYTPGPLSVILLRETWQTLIRPALTLLGVAGVGAGGYGNSTFPFSISVDEIFAGVLPSIAIFDGCTVDGVKYPAAEGNEALTVELEIGYLSLSENGQQIWSPVRSIL